MKIRDEDFNVLAELVKTQYGIDLTGKKYVIETRLTNYVLDCGYNDFSEYLQSVYADRSGIEMTNIISRLTTNYTYFRREDGHFKHFSEVFLKEAEKTVFDKDLRIWSAGCSYGNEPYELAMLLHNHFGRNELGWDFRILATDISFNALRMAKRGVFAEQAVDKLPTEWRNKYFNRQVNGTYQVTDEIRSSVVFKYHNLMDPITFKKRFDLIVCRNVRIYFDDKTRAELVERFYDATEPGGYLYIGHAECFPKNTRYIQVAPAVYKKPLEEETENE